MNKFRKTTSLPYRDKDKDKNLCIGLQEFVVGYSKAPEQPQSNARPICHSHAMTRTGHEPATIRIAGLELAATHCATGDDDDDGICEAF